MKSFIALALVSAASAMSEVESAFLGYITQYGKSYGTVAEYQFRLEQFSRNHAEVIAHNLSESTFKLGFNKMSDWSQAEYKALLTYKPMPESEKNYVNATFDINAASNSVDWRSNNDVQAIKDQGQCGSCWAFSAVSALESAWRIHHGGNLQSFSEQQLVDCSTANYGCNGGWQYQAFNFYKSNGADLESAYKYTAKTETCKETTSSYKTTGYVNVAANNPTAMKTALASQPLSVSIEADKSVFQSYSSGIFNSAACGTGLDHATNVVGWGTSGSTDYWIMRNSWGTTWGEQGYMRLQITTGAGICGIQSEPLYPTV